MPLYIASLNSGSNGNCYYVGNENEAVFIDAGLSCRETERRMRGLNLDMEKVKAIFISHEHSDHITGMCGIAKKWKIPVYITPQTRANSRVPLPPEWALPFEAGQKIVIGTLQILAFEKYHDACHPHSFVVSDGSINIGVFTDLGKTCDKLEQHLSECHAAFLEANYDEAMLANGNYPY
ncbi:MAG: MBL fold metallo-hydrolase, partial [Chitinophagaceae bacterium]